jgi:3-phenylpropionate/cinnamic acid dioxygenase small subunit
VQNLYERATRRYDDGTPRTRHVTSNVVVHVDGDAETATARAYYTVFQQTDELALQPIIAGRYHDTFHRVADRWWFDTREIFVDLTGDLRQHLLFEF